jgi:molybdopterin/thiamine biosynthesis adenylyltransferase
VQRAQASLGRLSELNRLVKTGAITVAISAVPDEALRVCRLVIVCDGSVDEQLIAGRRLRALGVPYIAASLHGFHAAMFFDLGDPYSYCTE